MKTYRLQSTPLVHAPGIFRWAKSAWAFKKDRKRILNVVKCWEVPISDREWGRVLSGKNPFRVEGENVLVDVKE